MDVPQKFLKKVIVVTGANRGIGYSILELFCQKPEINNNVLILTSRNRDEGHIALDNLKRTYPLAKDSLHYYYLDMSHGESINKFRKKLIEDFGHINVLFNNAAIVHKNPPKENRSKEIMDVFHTNTWGLINISEEFLPFFPKKGGSIINMSSQVSKMRFSKQLIHRFMDEDLNVSDLHKLFEEYREAYIKDNLEKTGWDDKMHHYGCYVMSKVFVNAYTRILDKRLKKQGINIKVNAVCPGWCKTSMGGEKALRDPLKGAETPVWVSDFSEEYDETLSGNFYFDKKRIDWI
jgi:NAD(P)-dependent dehydrogenase (short-subunit alcohol dehydrogenase family)